MDCQRRGKLRYSRFENEHFRHSYLVEILNMGAFLRLSKLFDSYTTIHPLYTKGG